mmetsp:Transcript_143319/g.357109  ORF Transcript_143319/g.357109 Transcript_143319/m.357109 type:complete len:531 (-) Transcript_143319:388-1980(-)
MNKAEIHIISMRERLNNLLSWQHQAQVEAALKRRTRKSQDPVITGEQMPYDEFDPCEIKRPRQQHRLDGMRGCSVLMSRCHQQSFGACYLGVVAAVVLGMTMVLMWLAVDPVLWALVAPTHQPQMSLATCSNASAEDLVAGSGLELPAWLSARWLDPGELSVLQPCQPRFPLVLQSTCTGDSCARTLDEWLASNATAVAKLKELAVSSGALLLRDLPGVSDEDFELLMLRLRIPPTSYTGSIGRRELVKQGSKRTITTRYPPSMVLMPHIEFGNKKTRPEFIAFYAKHLPEKYGETPLVDFQSVWERMDIELKLKFAKGIRFTTRMYPERPFYWIWGEYASTWKGAFGTDDADEALRRCRAMSGITMCRFCMDGALEYVMEFPAVYFHEKKHDAAVLSTTFGFWNADLPLFSLARFPGRLGLWERLHAYALLRLKFASTYLDPTPTRATFSDGSGLTTSESKHLSDLIWDAAVIYPAHAADIVLVDNRGTAHGRMNVGGRIEQRQVVSYIGGEYEVPNAISLSLEVTKAE